MLIAETFKDQEVFITGGSGYIGKGFIEKLLRSCPDVGKIYVLLRSKKGVDANQRLANVMKNPLFNRVYQENPQAKDKVIAIAGDCGELGLGISTEDLKKLQNVSIIIHSAASVRFDDALRDAILLNTRGTYELIKIAEKMTNLKVFMHVSTTYCYTDRNVIEEQVYPPYADWRTTIKLAETYSTETLNILNLKYGNNQPNTYTFTKSLAEQVVEEYKHRLPVIIFRPSIVISAMEEPAPGWVDNFNGPIGMLVACGIGILRTNHADPDIVADFVPVDVVVRAMIIACYKKIHEDPNIFDKDYIDVINCAASSIRSITMGDLITIGKRIIKETPFEKTLWVPGGSITRCFFWNFTRFITLQLFMSILVDTAIRFTNGKPFLLKLQRRIFAANQALYYFLSNSWKFKNDKFYNLNALVPKSEIDQFSFLKYSTVEPEDFLRKAARGARQFLLNEPPDCSQAALTRMKIYKTVHCLAQIIVGLFICRILFRYLYSTFF